VAAEMTGAPPRPRSSSRGTLIGAVVALISFLLLLGLIATLARQPANRAAPSGPTDAVVVASRNLTARQPVGPGDLAVKQMYASDVPAGAYGRVDEIKGMMAAANISAGQPITPGLVVKPGQAGAPSDLAFLPLPPGYVATTLPSSELQGVAGYVRPGDSISVIAVVPTSGQQNGGSNSRTVLTNVHVLGVGVAPTKQGSNQPGQAASTTLSSLTVMLTQCQSEVLNWFLANAQVRYTLESYKDYQQAPSGPDQTCSSVSSAQGITRADISRRYPGIFNS